AELGRWEIQLVQEAIALLQGPQRGDYTDGVQVGRDLFKTLPENNPLVERERDRWSGENRRDECFADMYVHPQETDYNLHSLFELIDASGLEFVGFSNPQFWQLERLLDRSAALMARGTALSERNRYRLIELLDPKSVTHYEFFLVRSPLERSDWSEDEALLHARAQVYPCLQGWPSQTFFDKDFQLVSLTPLEYSFLQACEAGPQQTVQTHLAATQADLAMVRSLYQRQLIVLSPG
ncbi:MAG: SAM-dependent methyltransferase, partial [Spirulinaceae cyanobacterium]